jgi:hypothetical protein
MFNKKWGIIAGGGAFALALLTSLVLGQTSLLVALVRALCFMALFFGIGTGTWALITLFIPELLPGEPRNDDAVNNVFSGESAGSQVNITVDDEHSAALPDSEYDAPETGGEIGQFSDLVTNSVSSAVDDSGRMDSIGDIDENPDIGYTGGTEELTPAFENIKLGGAGDFSLDFGAFVPDGTGNDEADNTDSDMDSFSFFSGGGSSDGVDEPPAPVSSTSSRNKPMKLEGDFDPKEIAAGLRTVLKKDKG